MQDLKLLQQRYTNLKTLEHHLYGKASKGLSEAYKDNTYSSHKALSQIDVQLKAIPSLEEVIIRIYDGILSSPTKQAILNFNWIVLLGDKGRNTAI